LLHQQIEATQDVVQAEEDYKNAIKDAQELGVVFDDEEQSLEFLEHFALQADDGYRISQENDLVQHADSNKIQTWMDLTSTGEPPATDCDDWNFKSIAFGEAAA
jgi:hypothetical protein